nr:PREDICTED: E3 ubiquitin-protein ligase ZNRF2 isoform X1 [Latimeria chalumnae]|eukprot:XP_014343040.1 PREDICTED: E3 ubiquitin-protein ligase ZNRF2 isoform X1 [Latimeria chalumnae]
MGAKQSNPAANGRTRAYSGSDLPSSTSTSSANGSSRSAAVAMRYSYGASSHHHGASGATAGVPQPLGPRTRSVGGGGGGVGGSGATSRGQSLNQSSLNIPNNSGTYSSQDSGSSTPEEGSGGRDRSAGGHGGAPRLLIGSLPTHLSPHLLGGFKCPVCSKFVPSDEMDLHLVMCLTKPRITYNGLGCCRKCDRTSDDLLKTLEPRILHVSVYTLMKRHVCSGPES